MKPTGNAVACWPIGETGDDVGRVTGLGGFGDLAHRAVTHRGVIIRDHDYDPGHEQADERGEIEIVGGPDATVGDHDAIREKDNGSQARREMAETTALVITPPMSVLPGLPPLMLTKRMPQIAPENRNAAEDERINHRRRRVREGKGADQNRADQTDRIGLENVRRHARTIADVVAHVIGDRRRVARIVFLQAALDFTNEIGADVGRLGVNAAAQSREDADQTRAERQPDEAAHGEIVAQSFCRRRCRKFRPRAGPDRPRADPVTAPPLKATRIAAVRDLVAA